MRLLIIVKDITNIPFYHLMIWLLFQLFLPLITAFLPVGMLYFFPFLGIEMGIYSNVIAILLSFQMLLDACVTFLIIRDYRRAISRIFLMFCAKRFIRVNNQSQLSTSGLARRKSDLATPAQNSILWWSFVKTEKWLILLYTA